MTKIDTIETAQADMRKSYANGTIGILASGNIWLIAAIVTAQLSVKHGIWALLIGGMFIHPVSVVVGKFFGVSGTHQKGNPLGLLAMETTIFMLMCIPLAFLLSIQHTEWFFQGMLMIIGGRYLIFKSIYGIKSYWILGTILALAAFTLFSFKAPSLISAITGSLIEISFGIYMLISYRKATN